MIHEKTLPKKKRGFSPSLFLWLSIFNPFNEERPKKKTLRVSMTKETRKQTLKTSLPRRDLRLCYPLASFFFGGEGDERGGWVASYYHQGERRRRKWSEKDDEKEKLMEEK